MKFALVRTIEAKYSTWLNIWLPATVPMQDKPAGIGKGASIPINSDKWHYIEAINDERGYVYARSVGRMWINTAYNQSVPYTGGKAESIICSGNFISYEQELNDHVQVRAFGQTEQLLNEFDPALINWYTRPYLFFKASATNYTKRLINVGSAIDCFLPLLRRTDAGGTGQLWLPTYKIEKFRDVPFTVTVRANVLNIRSSYSTSSPKIGEYKLGNKITVTAYRLCGASVWGMTNIGWVCLLYNDVPGSKSFTTDWVLKSPQIVPPAVS